MQLLQISEKKTGSPTEKWAESMNGQFPKKGIPNDQQVEKRCSKITDII